MDADHHRTALKKSKDILGLKSVGPNLGQAVASSNAPSIASCITTRFPVPQYRTLKRSQDVPVLLHQAHMLRILGLSRSLNQSRVLNNHDQFHQSALTDQKPGPKPGPSLRLKARPQKLGPMPSPNSANSMTLKGPPIQIPPPTAAVSISLNVIDLLADLFSDLGPCPLPTPPPSPPPTPPPTPRSSISMNRRYQAIAVHA